jgi:hypothetical protein
MVEEIFLIRLEVNPEYLISFLSNNSKEKFKNPLPKDSILFCVDYNETKKKILLYFLSKTKGFKIEEGFIDHYKNRIAKWDLDNKP